jgi:hypothetical protein
VILNTICNSNDINIFYIYFELDCDWSKVEEFSSKAKGWESIQWMISWYFATSY